jgi:hypothetical protein
MNRWGPRISLGAEVFGMNIDEKVKIDDCFCVGI